MFKYSTLIFNCSKANVTAEVNLSINLNHHSELWYETRLILKKGVDEKRLAPRTRKIFQHDLLSFSFQLVVFSLQWSINEEALLNSSTKNES